MQQADTYPWTTAYCQTQHASLRVRSPTDIYFFQHTVTAWLKPAQAQSHGLVNPVKVCCRSVRFFFITAPSPRVLFLSEGF